MRTKKYCVVCLACRATYYVTDAPKRCPKCGGTRASFKGRSVVTWWTTRPNSTKVDAGTTDPLNQHLHSLLTARSTDHGEPR